MSLEKTVVSLKLQSGELLDGIPVENTERTLAQFLDGALKQLESESQIQLPDTEEELIDPKNFKVFDEQHQELALDGELGKQPYFVQCLEEGKTPVLYLESPIFWNAEQVKREEHVRTVLRRQTHTSGMLRPAVSVPPNPPPRTSSLSGRTTNREAMVFMAGRKEYMSGLPHLKRTQNTGSMAIYVNEDVFDRLLESGSLAGSEDTSSIYSSASTSTDMDGSTGVHLGRNRPGSAPTSRRVFTRRGSDVTRSSASSEPVHVRYHSGDATYPSAQTPDSVSEVLTLGSFSGADNLATLDGGSGLTIPLSMPRIGFRSESPNPPIMEESETVDSCPSPNGMENGEISCGSPMLEVTNDEGGEVTLPSAHREAVEREMSPGLLERPLSPDQQGASPGVSPSGSPRLKSRKLRLATKRKTKMALSDRRKQQHTAETPEGASSGSKEGQVKPSFTRRGRTIYDRKSRVTSSLFPHGAKVFGNIKTFVVDFDIPSADLTVEMEIRGDYTVGQIKDNLWNLLREQGFIHDELIALWDPEKFTFTYQKGEETYELYDEQQLFQTATVVQLWRSERREKGHLWVELKKTESREEKTMNMEISAMIGIGLYQLQFANNDELDITRRKMVAVRRNAVTSRDSIQYCMEMELNFQVLPPHVLEQIGDNKILVRVYYKRGSYQTFQMDMHTTVDEFLPQVFPDKEAKRQRLGLPAICNVDEYVLKVAGQESYLYGSYELIQFAYIVKSLSKKEDVELALVKKLDPNKDRCRDIPDWNLIDDSTGLTGTHSDLSALSKEHTQVFTMSMWDIQRKFRLRVVGLDNLRNTEVEVVYVDVGIYHGGELLAPEKYTSEVAVTTYPRWNQWLGFDIAVKNLPKAGRLCLQVVGGIRTKEGKKKSSRGRSKSIKDDKKGDGLIDKPLHWVNMQILDHRALLHQGLLKLTLWPILPDSNEGVTSGVFPMGSTAVNPDGNNSVALYIELESYAHPVACPTGGWGEDRPVERDQSLKEGSVFKKDLARTIALDPLTHLDKAQKELIWKFRSHCATIPEALPKFLRCVDWADLEQVCEAHRLLKIWRPITLEVALELLDYHFADQKVRSLAVRRLEKLSSDELLCYLLQLIQVLKFEPYHESALARFLLKRALQSKRIGHYFYWYLRSEMDTPEFNQRFGILLEGYLRGCGEAMFQEIQGQHKAVCDIMAVAASVKRYIGEQQRKGVVDYARDELAKYQLPSSFSPPYDPGVRMGALDISKCRVMDSKKSPLWLEFQNMDSTAVIKRPIKVIAKHGDDLRQDMLTLQMLSLMDKLWQANGLDLYIIPYGCIATGHNMGMIQVVQDAETVAKIQQKHGGSFSALKDEPLHDWLRHQNPTQNRSEAAVERFMLSCAGYCVATYILGIGDRHNDNIMVTTSGNLFHIDFGHFLGNKKEFFGVNRERAPFVLTPDFEYVMGKRSSDLFKRFEETAVKAYMIIRKHANLFINLFSMMKCTGIPELGSVKDIDYLRSVLVLEKSNPEAEEHFKSQIQKCLKLSWSTQLNWLTHNIVHGRS